MNANLKKTRLLTIPAFIAFAAGIWPTVYSPLGEDRAGNPMRENRFTGTEEIKPLGSEAWIDAVTYREQTRAARHADLPLIASKR
jgi:hypothetical protein